MSDDWNALKADPTVQITLSTQVEEYVPNFVSKSSPVSLIKLADDSGKLSFLPLLLSLKYNFDVTIVVRTAAVALATYRTLETLASTKKLPVNLEQVSAYGRLLFDCNKYDPKILCITIEDVSKYRYWLEGQRAKTVLIIDEVHYLDFEMKLTIYRAFEVFDKTSMALAPIKIMLISDRMNDDSPIYKRLCSFFEIRGIDIAYENFYREAPEPQMEESRVASPSDPRYVLAKVCAKLDLKSVHWDELQYVTVPLFLEDIDGITRSELCRVRLFKEHGQHQCTINRGFLKMFIAQKMDFEGSLVAARLRSSRNSTYLYYVAAWFLGNSEKFWLSCGKEDKSSSMASLQHSLSEMTTILQVYKEYLGSSDTARFCDTFGINKNVIEQAEMNFKATITEVGITESFGANRGRNPVGSFNMQMLDLSMVESEEFKCTFRRHVANCSAEASPYDFPQKSTTHSIDTPCHSRSKRTVTRTLIGIETSAPLVPNVANAARYKCHNCYIRKSLVCSCNHQSSLNSSGCVVEVPLEKRGRHDHAP